MHYAFYMNTILIIWSGNKDEDEGEPDCHMDCDKGSYSVMKYDTVKCIICTNVQGCTQTYVRTHIIAYKYCLPKSAQSTPEYWQNSKIFKSRHKRNNWARLCYN